MMAVGETEVLTLFKDKIGGKDKEGEEEKFVFQIRKKAEKNVICEGAGR